ncbi:pleckstrin homology domain-containing family G member 3-like isoform X3 [Neoarius graeffei]|uniref:pleckstrin homology domain-containing family G member 3-like isoform X3 n=1 Tax=Neoarius graeffei TaxID=443677 RepID=UPI00298D1A84|nr:pleckstrin homology domain-containing family G member 3-like isoform X3 [Neoarius graeffei]XP_060772158.1 pleckstrin homology domain-containing family G member 3-like isoform X3 [Neoarius graeffei]XP_060772159.1 pleckstrin homology domain-containing family G member 3-like isoform X3 [Neoarius graeffei]XP_060772160.1 pleckstrin homology domain-containing family G member 3-like isoform X3 [Neoarius graeffei]XP_060772161.1 pleckstrin homology domain-containing family G member 3-like isoform X3 
MAPNPELTYLDRVIIEIIETERMYVRDLHSIVEGYLAHIIDTEHLPIIPDQVCALFGNIEDIYEFNSELLQELDLCKNDPVAIAKCFVLKSDYFEIYTQYCTNYPNSVAALTECMRNKTLLKFFMERQEVLKHPLPLGSYLLKPVQRILKYHLLLQEIAKHFDPDEDGYDVVEEAINTMTEVAWYINSMKRKHEHAVRLQEVQSLLINWHGPDLTTYGELVLEGTFRFHHTKHNRTLFLFERVLLITKRHGENFVYKTHISCSTLMLMEGAKDSLCFSVTHYKHPKQPHTVQARTLEEKKLWTHHIKRLILENHHTIIPQKAKEVILEMDPMYQKYRFNSERKKKAQSDDFTHTRQSELTKEMLKNKAMLKDEEWQGHEDTQQFQQEERQVCEDPDTNKSSPSIVQFQNNTAELGATKGIKSMSDCEQSKIRHTGEHNMSAVEGSDQNEVKEEIVLNQDGQSSEEEVEEDCAESENHSILPPSVLDKASVIAEHFISNVRQSSAAPDELQSPQRIQQGVTSSKNAAAHFNLLSPGEEMMYGSDRHACRRRDSTLSKQERLLIDKIRNYYETAEQQDAGFSLKRRESLTYIPSGLVRTSVSHFNKIPHSDYRIKPPNTETSLVASLPTSSDIRTKPDKLRHVCSREADGSVSQKSEEFSEECFHSSAEMIKIWQEMEKEVTGSLRECKFRDMSRFRGTSSVSQRFSRNTEAQVKEQELKAADDLSTITEESPIKGIEDENEKESTENAVLSLRKKFSQNIQSRETFNQPRRWASETTINTVNQIPSLTDEETKTTIKGKPNLALSLTACVQVTQDVQQIQTSSSNSVTVLSPERSYSKSPMPFEGFLWPDVSELCSKYSSLECASLTPLTSTANALSPGYGMDNKASRIQRAGSLDQKMVGFGWTNLQDNKVNSDYCISAQAPLPKHRTITVLEKVNKTDTHTSQSQNHVQVQSPTSREKMSLLSVTERCRLYEDLDEAAFRMEPETRNKDNKTDKHSNATQQGVVKNLREKFLNLK